MKIKLLDDGGFTGLSAVKFPLEVTEEDVTVFGGIARVSVRFMTLSGAFVNEKDIGSDDFYLFLPDEFEVVE